MLPRAPAGTALAPSTVARAPLVHFEFEHEDKAKEAQRIIGQTIGIGSSSTKPNCAAPDSRPPPASAFIDVFCRRRGHLPGCLWCWYWPDSGDLRELGASDWVEILARHWLLSDIEFWERERAKQIGASRLPVFARNAGRIRDLAELAAPADIRLRSALTVLLARTHCSLFRCVPDISQNEQI